MKKISLIFSFFIFLPVFADEVQYIDRKVAVVSIMNKAAGKATTVTLPVGQTQKFEKLSVLVRACKQTAPYKLFGYFGRFILNHSLRQHHS